MAIDMTKKYKTRGGRSVEIFDTNCIDMLGRNTISGIYIKEDGNRVATVWQRNGNFLYFGDSDLDLIEDIPVPAEPERLSLSADEIAAAFATAPSADAALFELGFPMPPPEPLEVDFWISVYRRGTVGHPRLARDGSLRHADEDIVACINIKRTVIIGEGL